MFTQPKIQVPQPLGVLVSQNFALKSWVSFLFSSCSELQCSRLLFASLLTAVPPDLKLYFRVPSTCSVVYFLLTVILFSFTQRTCKEVAQLPLLSHTGSIQGDGVEVTTMRVLTDCVIPKVFLGKSNILVSTLEEARCKSIQRCKPFQNQKSSQGFSLEHLILPRRNINVQVYIASC